MTLDNNDSNNSLGHARIIMPSYWKYLMSCMFHTEFDGRVVVSSKSAFVLVCISNCLDDYKVVMGIKKSNDAALVQFLSLKSNTWKIIGQFNYSFIYDNP
ncbi:hypothetical protein Tco_1269521, partial [Tanacetum coccineum]